MSASAVASAVGQGVPRLEVREKVLGQAQYVDDMVRVGHRLPLLLRHIHGLYAGIPNARAWRRYLSEQGTRPGAGAEVLTNSLRLLQCAA